MRCGVFILLFLGSAAGPARAATPLFCAGAARLQGFVKNCATNYLALDASLKCLEGVDQAILAAQARLTGTMARIGRGQEDRQQNGQHGNFSNSGADLAATQASFQELLATARAVRAEVARYPLLISLPGGVSRAAAASNRRLAALARFDCYKDPLLVLKSDLVSLDQKIADLERAAGATSSLSARTGRTIANLSSAEGAPEPGAKAGGAGNGGRGSTITGSTEAKKAVAPGEASTISGKSAARAHSGEASGISQEEQGIAEAQGSLLRALSSRGTGARARLESTGSAGEGEEAAAEALKLESGAGEIPAGDNEAMASAGAEGAGRGIGEQTGGQRAGQGAPPVVALGSLDEKLGQVIAGGGRPEKELSLFARAHQAHTRALRAGRVK